MPIVQDISTRSDITSCSDVLYDWHTYLLILIYTDHLLRLLLICLDQYTHQVTDHIMVLVNNEEGSGQRQITNHSSSADIV